MRRHSLRIGLSLVALAISGGAFAGPFISSVETDLARYAPGEPVVVKVRLANGSGQPASGVQVSIVCKHLGQRIEELPAQSVTLANGSKKSLTFAWRPPSLDFQGYDVEVWVASPAGKTLDQMNTAVDVSSTWTKFPRYGYVSSFPEQPKAVSADEVQALKDFHLNALQFYDWQSKHHVPLAGSVAEPASMWQDIANRSNSRTTVLDLIEACHKANMSAMNYNLIDGAWAGYGQDGSGVDARWGLFRAKDATSQWSFSLPNSWSTSTVFLFNPANADWQNYLFRRVRDVFAAYPFDGWHVDSIGGPPSTVYDYSGKVVDVWPTFRGFLNNAKAALRKDVVFNNVGGYGMYDVCANSMEDVVYVECWPSAGQRTYNDLKTVIDQGVSWSKGKGVVLPAYMDYDYANSRKAGTPGTFNEPGALLTDAAIFAAGGSHLELGDGSAMLDSEYFPNRNLTPTRSLLATLQRYYDFDVANENLLRSGLADNENSIEVALPTSKNGSPNTVWAFAKSNSSFHVLNFVNLLGESSNQWRDDAASYPPPTREANVPVKYRITGPISGVFWGTPDLVGDELQPLTYSTGADATGPYVTFKLPSLSYWDVVYLER